MADPLSIAAAAAGFVSLAGQLADGIIKLRELCIAVKNAPSDVETLCDEMDMLRRLLEEAGAAVQQSLPPDMDLSVMRDAFSQLEKMRSQTTAVLDSLEAGLIKCATTRLRFPFKKKEVEAMLLGVERGKSSLLLAVKAFESRLAAYRHNLLSADHQIIIDRQGQLEQQCSRIDAFNTSAMDKQTQEFAALSHGIAESAGSSKRLTNDVLDHQRKFGHEIRNALSSLQFDSRSLATKVTGQANEIQQITTIVTTTQNTVSDLNTQFEKLSTRPMLTPPGHQSQSISRTRLSFHLIPLGFTIEHTTSMDEKGHVVQKPAKTFLTIRLPHWFLGQQYDMQFQRATAGWPFHLSVHRIVSWDDPIIQACRDGNILKVKLLLSTKKNSVYDRTANGNTLFTEAISSLESDSGQLEVCKVLRQEGIFAQFQHEDYTKSLMSFQSRTLVPSKQARELLHLMEAPGNADKEWYMDYIHHSATDVATTLDLLAHPRNINGAGRLAELRHFVWDSLWFYGCFWDRYMRLPAYLVDSLSDDAMICELRHNKRQHGWMTSVVAFAVAEAARDVPPHFFDCAILACVRAGLDLHRPRKYWDPEWQGHTLFESCKTPFAILYNQIVRLINQRDGFGRVGGSIFPALVNKFANEVLSRWITGIFLAGVDLTAYSAKELPGLQIVFLEQWEKFGVQTTLSTGPSPDDWSISFWIPCEEFANHFWRMTEGQPIVQSLASSILHAKLRCLQDRYLEVNMPGSWSKSHEDHAEQLARLQYALLHDCRAARIEVIEHDLISMTEHEFFGWHLAFSDFGWYSSSEGTPEELWLPRFRLNPVPLR